MRKIDPAGIGIVTTVVGTGRPGCRGVGDAKVSATATQLKAPSDMAVDRRGDLIVVDENLTPSEGCGVVVVKNGRVAVLASSASLFPG